MKGTLSITYSQIGKKEGKNKKRKYSKILTVSEYA
jgi:hypothetical protein